MAIVADPDAHMAAMSLAGPYLVADPGQQDNTNYVPESSRRAGAVPVYAAIRSLGRAGVAAMIERNCAQAQRMAKRLVAIPGAEVLNDVVLNQVLVRLPCGDDANRAAVSTIQRDGTCWLGGTTWNGEYVLRVSISTGRRRMRTSTAPPRRSPPQLTGWPHTACKRTLMPSTATLSARSDARSKRATATLDRERVERNRP